MERLIKQQAGVIIRRLAKQGIDAEADHRPWGSAISFTSKGTRYRVETVEQAYRWTGYPSIEGR